MLKLKHVDRALWQEQMQERAAWKSANQATSNDPAPVRSEAVPSLTAEQRARLICGGPNAGRVRREGCHECAWGKVAGCWRCGSR